MKWIKSPNSAFRKDIKPQVSWQKRQRIHLGVKSIAGLPTFTPGHHTSRVMPPYSSFSLQGPATGQHTSMSSRTGNLLKWCTQKTLCMDGFLPIFRSSTWTSPANLFPVRETVDRNNLGMKWGDNSPETSLEDRQYAYELQSLWCWNGQEWQSNM